MAKGSKFGLSLLSSFQSCRPKDLSSLVHTPLPKASNFFSPANSKSFDVSFPTSPSPTPSILTPPPSKHNVTTSRISPFGCECSSKSSRMHIISSELSLHKYRDTRKEGKGKMYKNSTVSSDIDEGSRGKTKIKKSEASVSNDTPHLSSSRCHSNNLLKTSIGEVKNPLMRKSVRTRRFKRFGSREWKDGVIEGKPVLGRSLVPSMVDGGVNQSFVVVKKSVDPYEDFKKSMMEMIMEKQMSEPKELEELLMSFLSLNSRMHHQVIIEAFTDIWKEVPCGGSSN